jgi:FtsZ-binding cell division protein ZapB
VRSTLVRSTSLVVVVTLAVLAVVASSAPGVGAQDDPAASPIEELERELGSTQAELDGVVGEIAASVAELAQVDAELAGARDERAGHVADRTAAEVAREEPLAVRRAMALEAYMAGDPYVASLLDEIVDAGSSIDGARERALYTSVVDWADATLDELDAEIEQADEAIAALDERIPELDARRTQLMADQQALSARRDALAAEVEDLGRRLAALLKAPLTGLPVDRYDPRPVLIVKIDNVGGARPQTGLNQADIVVEERVEGGLTRFAAMFQSTGSDPVGPVRSARTSDVHLFANLGRPLFAYSGANTGVGTMVATSNLVDVGAGTHRDLYERTRDRRAPHNLFTSTTALWAAAEGSAAVPIFEYREDGEAVAGGARPARRLDVDYGATSAAFDWNGQGWVRSTDGRAHPDSTGSPVAPANVVVRFTSYVPSPADGRSPEAVVTGSGELWVLTGGQVVVGRWEQSSPTAPTRWLTASGEPVRLTPGRTWILMPDPGGASVG